MLFKIIGLALIFLSCASAGFIKSSNLKQRENKLGSLIRGLHSLAGRINTENTEAERLIAVCFKENYVYYKDKKISFDTSFLQKQDIRILTEFFEEFGIREPESEHNRTELFASFLEQQQNDAKKECSELCRFYNSLGVLSGIFLCIFFL